MQVGGVTHHGRKIAARREANAVIGGTIGRPQAVNRRAPAPVAASAVEERTHLELTAVEQARGGRERTLHEQHFVGAGQLFHGAIGLGLAKAKIGRTELGADPHFTKACLVGGDKIVFELVGELLSLAFQRQAGTAEEDIGRQADRRQVIVINVKIGVEVDATAHLDAVFVVVGRNAQAAFGLDLLAVGRTTHRQQRSRHGGQFQRRVHSKLPWGGITDCGSWGTQP